MGSNTKNKELEILAAAEREFMSKGYAGAKTTAIAKAAGVTHAMLHYYFRTKENLFNMVFDKKTEVIANSIVSSFSNPHLSLTERIRCGIESHFDLLAENPDLPRFVVNELISKVDRREVMRQKIGLVAGAVIANLQQEIDAQSKQGLIERVRAVDIMLDIVSLNVFVFVAYPLIEVFTDQLYGSREQFLAARKKENVELIMRRLIKCVQTSSNNCKRS